MKKIIIVAVAENNIIGRTDGNMPWHSKEEFKHFKETTFGFPVIMGRKTFESLGKPLKGRLNIILTQAKGLEVNYDNVLIVHSLDEAYLYCGEKNYEKIFVIGGGQIYKQAMDAVDEMIVSFMKFKAEGDIYFPNIDENIWIVKSRENHEEFDIVTFTRKNQVISEKN